ncbi:MAG: site-specific integrase [Methanobacterium sp. ERen5]|nr:MAG: site-specific integrase [Methanobacterium sp. ERen5]
MDDVKRSLEYSNVTYRAITLLMVSSGMSRAEISSLTFKDLFKAFSLDNDPRTIKELLDKLNELDNLVPIWHIKRIKTGKHYFTFNSPEASLAIFGYLSDIDIKYGVVPLPSNKLFSNITTGIPVSPDSITEVYRRINKKAGFRKVNGRLLVRPHSLRKLFASTLEKNDFPYIATRHILGHSVDKTTGAYFKADPESVRDKYLDVVGQISTSAVKVVVVDRYDEVKDEIEDLKLKQVLYERQIKALSKNKS